MECARANSLETTAVVSVTILILFDEAAMGSPAAPGPRMPASLESSSRLKGPT